ENSMSFGMDNTMERTMGFKMEGLSSTLLAIDLSKSPQAIDLRQVPTNMPSISGVAERKFPPPPRVLWVAAHDLECALFPQFLATTELPAHSWKTVASRLRKLTDWRQKDGRQLIGADLRRSNT